MFITRIFSYSFGSSTPCLGLDDVEHPVTRRKLQAVPILRLVCRGVTEDRIRPSVLLHVHRCYPFFFVQVPDPIILSWADSDKAEHWLSRFVTSIERCVSERYQEVSAVVDSVIFRAEFMLGKPFLGYFKAPTVFIKIFPMDYSLITVIASILRNRLVFSTCFLVYETHLNPFMKLVNELKIIPLEPLCIEAQKVFLRAPLDSRLLTDNLETLHGLNIQLLELSRISTCDLELDTVAAYIKPLRSTATDGAATTDSTSNKRFARLWSHLDAIRSNLARTSLSPSPTDPITVSSPKRTQIMPTERSGYDYHTQDCSLTFNQDSDIIRNAVSSIFDHQTHNSTATSPLSNRTIPPSPKTINHDDSPANAPLIVHRSNKSLNYAHLSAGEERSGSLDGGAEDESSSAGDDSFQIELTASSVTSDNDDDLVTGEPAESETAKGLASIPSTSHSNEDLPTTNAQHFEFLCYPRYGNPDDIPGRPFSWAGKLYDVDPITGKPSRLSPLIDKIQGGSPSPDHLIRSPSCHDTDDSCRHDGGASTPDKLRNDDRSSQANDGLSDESDAYNADAQESIPSESSKHIAHASSSHLDDTASDGVQSIVSLGDEVVAVDSTKFQQRLRLASLRTNKNIITENTVLLGSESAGNFDNKATLNIAEASAPAQLCQPPNTALFPTQDRTDLSKFDVGRVTLEDANYMSAMFLEASQLDDAIVYGYCSTDDMSIIQGSGTIDLCTFSKLGVIYYGKTPCNPVCRCSLEMRLRELFKKYSSQRATVSVHFCSAEECFGTVLPSLVQRVDPDLIFSWKVNRAGLGKIVVGALENGFDILALMSRFPHKASSFLSGENTDALSNEQKCCALAQLMTQTGVDTDTLACGGRLPLQVYSLARSYKKLSSYTVAHVYRSIVVKDCTNATVPDFNPQVIQHIKDGNFEPLYCDHALDRVASVSACGDGLSDEDSSTEQPLGDTGVCSVPDAERCLLYYQIDTSRPSRINEKYGFNHENRCHFGLAGRRIRVSALCGVEQAVQTLVYTMRIVEAMDVVRETCEMAKVFGITFEECKSRGSQFTVESFLLGQARAESYVVGPSPTKLEISRMTIPECVPLVAEPISSAYYTPMAVFDFVSLYPSVMVAFNLCYTTILGRDVFTFTPKISNFQLQLHQHDFASDNINPLHDCLFSPAGGIFLKKRIRVGVIPTIMEEALEIRAELTKEEQRFCNLKDELLDTLGQLSMTSPNTATVHDTLNSQDFFAELRSAALDHLNNIVRVSQGLHAKQLALKMLMNTTYGYTSATYSGRMPCVEVAEAIVEISRQMLERSIAIVEHTFHGRVVYADTDSMFVIYEDLRCTEFSSEVELLHAAAKRSEDIMAHINSTFPHPMRLKLERLYYPAILITKKRYVGRAFQLDSIYRGYARFIEMRRRVSLLLGALPGDSRRARRMIAKLQQNSLSNALRSTLDPKGIEAIRSDSCGLVRNAVSQALILLFKNPDFSLLLRHFTNLFLELLFTDAPLSLFTYTKKARIGESSKERSMPIRLAYLNMNASRACYRYFPNDDTARLQRLWLLPDYYEPVSFTLCVNLTSTGLDGRPAKEETLLETARDPSDLVVMSDNGECFFVPNVLYYIERQLVPALERIFALSGFSVSYIWSLLKRVLLSGCSSLNRRPLLSCIMQRYRADMSMKRDAVMLADIKDDSSGSGDNFLRRKQYESFVLLVNHSISALPRSQRMWHMMHKRETLRTSAFPLTLSYIIDSEPRKCDSRQYSFTAKRPINACLACQSSNVSRNVMSELSISLCSECIANSSSRLLVFSRMNSAEGRYAGLQRICAKCGGCDIDGRVICNNHACPVYNELFLAKSTARSGCSAVHVLLDSLP